MYASVRSIQLETNEMDEFINTWNKLVAPHLQNQAGFKSAQILKSTEKNNIIIVSYWESEEALQNWRSSDIHLESHTKIHDLMSAMSSFSAYSVIQEL